MPKLPDPSQVPTVRKDARLDLFAELFPRGEALAKRPAASPPPTAAALPAEVAAVMDDPALRFGKYVRTERLGQGGMAEVWKAWDLGLGRWVALKFLKDDDPRELARFRREARVAARLSHPHIAAIFGAEEARGKPFIVMQYVHGRTLRKLSAARADLAARLLRDAALAVHAAHEKGVIHRDLKPDNLMVERLSRDGRDLHLYVMDFGLAKHAELSASLSTTGTLAGTPFYMSPEQARGRRDLDRRTDVYSLGATLYELVTGRPPFDGVHPYELIKKVVDEEPVPPRRVRPSLDRNLETVILKCLQKDPARRYATALDLAEDLSRWLEGRTLRARASSLLRRSTGRTAAPPPERRTRFIRFQSALLKLSRGNSGSLRSSLRALTETDARALGVERVSVWLFAGGGSRLECLDLYRRSKGAHGAAPVLEARRYPRYFKALAANRIVAADDAPRDPRTREFACDYLGPLGITSMMDAPIRRAGRIVGILCHEHTGRPRGWTLEEQEFASSVADLAALALEAGERRRMEAELERLRRSRARR
jgi:serine/threonine protein kinase